MMRQRGIVLTGYLAVIAVVLLGLAAWQIHRLEAQISDLNQELGAHRAATEQANAAAKACSDQVTELQAAARATAEAWKKRSYTLGEQRATLELELQRLLADRARPGEEPCQRAERVLNDEIDRRHPPGR